MSDDTNLDEMLTTISQEELDNNQPATPLTIDSYCPNLDNGQTMIGKISPAGLDAVMKVLQVLIKEKPVDNLIIRNSTVLQDTGNCIIEGDMSKVLVFEGNTMDLDIINPKKNVQLFGQFRTSNDIYFIDDDENSKYILDNGEIQLFLYKQDNELTEQATVSYDINDENLVCEFIIDKETRKIIKNLGKDQSYLEYLFHDNQIKALHIPETAIFKFKEYINSPELKGFNETNADLIVRTSSFLPVDAEDYKVRAYKDTDESYLIVTDCQIGGQIDVVIKEKCDITTSGNVII